MRYGGPRVISRRLRSVCRSPVITSSSTCWPRETPLSLQLSVAERVCRIGRGAPKYPDVMPWLVSSCRLRHSAGSPAKGADSLNRVSSGAKSSVRSAREDHISMRRPSRGGGTSRSCAGRPGQRRDDFGGFGPQVRGSRRGLMDCAPCADGRDSSVVNNKGRNGRTDGLMCSATWTR